MSTFTTKSSILKDYSATEREKTKNAIINKVRFEMPRRHSLEGVINAFIENGNEQLLWNYIEFLNNCELEDREFAEVLSSAHKVVNQLIDPHFANLFKAIINMSWIKRSAECKILYENFCVDIITANSKFGQIVVPQLIQLWVPMEEEKKCWISSTPDEEKAAELTSVHKLLDRIVTTVPMTFAVILENIEEYFPYFKKDSYKLGGYIHNMLWLLEYKPIFTESVMMLLLQQLVLLDVNAPRHEIEDTEIDEDEDYDIDGTREETMFPMDDFDCKKSTDKMLHTVAATLDVCMEKIFEFLKTRNPYGENLSVVQKAQYAQFMRTLLLAFGSEILPKHNTHHVQFLMFYYCSFHHKIAEGFLSSLWESITNPNVSSVIRQASVGYLSSFLARASYLPLNLLKYYLKELCDWAHQYILRSDQYRSNISLKANLVFYTICQAIFYVIAFRSRDLTADKKGLLFLQSLHLSGLVTSKFNPLRVCIQAVATAFAGVTRAYQLAYCHAILERNARRKLATVYINETETPEESLDTFFPFDPYLLKISGKRINPLYLQYRASDIEEESSTHIGVANGATEESVQEKLLRRKRGDSEMLEDGDVDDFLVIDKRQKLYDLARSQEREAQFTYGLSPGFQVTYK